MEPSSIWSSFSSTRVEVGVGALKRVGSLAARFGESAYLVGAESAHRSGALERCRSALEQDGIRVVIHDGRVGSDPTVHQANELAVALVDSGCDMIVAIGGGSVIDCVKAAAALAAHGGSAEDHLLGATEPVTSSVPTIAIPTTAGTGAELSKGAILTWPERLMKGGMRGEGLIPEVAIVDPLLTVTVPPDQTRFTGFDAFAHAVETYISRRSTPMTELFSSVAVVGIVANLRVALATPDNLEARSGLSLYATLMGYNLANSSTCLPHRLQYPIGVRTATAHGRGLAAIFPSWVQVTRGASSDKFETVATWIGRGLGRSVADVEDALGQFMEEIGLVPDLEDLGVAPGMVAELAAATDGSLGNDPWWSDSADLEVILQGAMKKETL